MKSGKARRFAVRLGVLNEAELQRMMSTAEAHGRTIPASGTFSSEEASREAERCMLCGCASTEICKLRRYAAEYDAQPSRYRGRRRTVRMVTSHPTLVFEDGKCISCGLCVAIARKAGEPFGLTFVGRGFDITVAAGLNQTWGEALRTAAEDAARACPTGAIHKR